MLGQLFDFGFGQKAVGQTGNHFAALGTRRRFHLNDHVKTAQKGPVHHINTVGNPHRRHGVLLEHAVEPTFIQLVVFLPIVEHIFHLIKQQQHVLLGKNVLCRAQSAHARFTAGGIALIIRPSHFDALQAQVLRQGPREFGFACACHTVHQNIAAFVLLSHHFGQVVLQRRHQSAQMAEVLQTQLRGRRGVHMALEQFNWADDFLAHPFGKLAAHQINFAAQRVFAGVIEFQQACMEQGLLMPQSMAHFSLGQLQHHRQTQHHLAAVKLTHELRCLREHIGLIHQNHKCEDFGFHRA